MIEKLLTYIKYGNRFCGIEHTTKDGKSIIYATKLKQLKKELLIDEILEENVIDNITHKLGKNQSAFLVLNNENVLTKTIESEQKDALKLVYKAFPNINLDDFYYEVLSQENIYFISLCRRDYIEDIINKYSELKLSVINISLGNNLVGSISNIINESQIFSSNARINIKSNKVKQIEKTTVTSNSCNINGLSIKNKHLLSFIGALQIILNTAELQTNFFDKKEELQDNFKQTRFFNLFLKIGGVFILGMLLLNFFFFNYYFNNVNELSQLSAVNQSTKNQIVKLNEIVSQKQKMVDDLLKSSGSKSSFYSNKIIHSIPNSILLTEFNYQPLQRRIKDDKPIDLKEKAINIVGKSNDSEAFSNWISLLERKDWIAHIDIIDYGAYTSKTSNFKIEIVLNNE